MALLVLIVATALRRSRQSRAGSDATASRSVPPARCEVRRITLAFDWDARALLQAQLAEIARAHDFGTAAGMKAGAAETLRALRGHLGDARYGIYERGLEPPDGAEAAFARRTIDLRARFEEEIVRGADTRDGSAPSVRADEGRGLVAVSVVVGAMVPMRPLPPVPTRDAFDRALVDVEGLTADELVAFEVVWSPAKDEDRMSSYELERVYPELLRLDDDAALGGVQCRYCMAPYPAELGRCPACGAPS